MENIELKSPLWSKQSRVWPRFGQFSITKSESEKIERELSPAHGVKLKSWKNI